MKLIALATLLSIPLFGGVLYWQIDNTPPYEFVNNLEELKPHKIKTIEFNGLIGSITRQQRFMLFEMLCDGDINWILVKPNESEVKFNWIEVENIN